MSWGAQLPRLTNGNIYVGRRSGKIKQLYGRLQDYYQNGYLSQPRNRTSLICKALLKYGMSQFVLLILEYVDSEDARVKREQYYLDTLDTPYNTQKSAGHPKRLRGVPQSQAQKDAS